MAFIYFHFSVACSRVTHELFTRKNFRATKYSREKILNLRNTHERKSWTYEIPTRKILNPRNTQEKKFWTHETATRKKFIPTKTRWYDGTRPRRPNIARDGRNLKHSFSCITTEAVVRKCCLKRCS